MEKRLIQSVDRAISILNYISSNGNDVRLVDLSKDLGLNKSTLHGILTTLEVGGLISQDKNSNRYSLGIKTYEFGKIYEQDFSLKKVVRPYLEKLSDEFHESVQLAMHSNDEVLYIDRIHSKYWVRLAAEIGKKDPLYCTAIGKLILSHLDEDELTDYMKRTEFLPRTVNTIIDPTEYRDELKKVKERRFSIDNEELEIGLICVGSPIVGKDGELIAIIGISGPTTRVNEEMLKRMEEKLVETTDEISNTLSKIM
jgi:DNA-binding IclR family transcriptional regulator